MPTDGDHNRGAAVIVVGTVFGSLGLVLVSTRLWVRHYIVKKLGLDDLFIVLGLVSRKCLPHPHPLSRRFLIHQNQILIITFLIMQILEIHHGVGRHQYYLNLSHHLLSQESNALALVYISETIFILSTMFTRISICLFLLLIFGAKRVWRWGLYAIIAFVTVTSLAPGISVLLQCQPIRKVWEPSQPGTCWRPETALAIGNFNGGEFSPFFDLDDGRWVVLMCGKASSIFCDWALATLPIAFMWNIQMSIKVKMGICVLMGMGAL